MHWLLQQQPICPGSTACLATLTTLATKTIQMTLMTLPTIQVSALSHSPPSRTQPHTRTHPLPLVLVEIKSKGLKTKISHTHSLVLSHSHTVHRADQTGACAEVKHRYWKDLPHKALPCGLVGEGLLLDAAHCAMFGCICVWGAREGSWSLVAAASAVLCR